MTELVDFLLARIAEDEAVAKAATPGPWAWEPPSSSDWPQGDQSLVALGDEWQPDRYFGGCSAFLREFNGTRELEGGDHLHRTAREVVSGWGYDASGTHASDEDRAHIARHDPARVLADCAARRRIVEECSEFRAVTAATAGDAPLAQALAQAGVVQGLERAVRLLASVYAGHSDYRQEWRP